MLRIELVLAVHQVPQHLNPSDDAAVFFLTIDPIHSRLEKVLN